MNNQAAIWSAVHFFTIWGIYSALEFDFHNNVIAAMLVPWLWLYLSQKRKIPAFLVLTVILSCQENMGLWATFIITGFLAHEKRLFQLQPSQFEWLLALGSLVYFYVSLSWIMPGITESTHSPQLVRYSHWGNGMIDIALSLLTHPFEVIEHLFTCDHPDATAKLEFHLIMLISGGWACLRHPHFLWMLIPIYAQKMLSNAPEFWGVGRQYSIEFVPIIAIAVMTMANTKLRKFRIFYPVLCLISFTATNWKMKERQDYFRRECVDLLYAPHYTSPLDIDLIQTVLDNIPPDIPLSVSGRLAPHLADRACIRTFPVTRDADMIVLLNQPGAAWPLTRNEFKQQVDLLQTSPRHITITNEPDILVFQVLSK